MEWSEEVRQRLMAPFSPEDIGFIPRGKGQRRAAIPHIDARAVMNRLDKTVGPENWSFDFDMLSPDGKKVKGRLTVLGVTKCDAGEAKDEDEPFKAAASDALKRCGVHFGIGRYLYSLEPVWEVWDEAKRRFQAEPKIPDAAVRRALAIAGYTGATTANPTPATRAGERAREALEAYVEKTATPPQRRTLALKDDGTVYCPETGEVVDVTKRTSPVLVKILRLFWRRINRFEGPEVQVDSALLEEVNALVQPDPRVEQLEHLRAQELLAAVDHYRERLKVAVASEALDTEPEPEAHPEMSGAWETG